MRRFSIPRGTAAILLLLMGACNAESSPGAGGSPETSGMPSAGGSGGGLHELSGELGVDEIEGGCPYVEAADGTRYEVIWPGGWQVDAGSGELLNPDGEVVAQAGDRISLRGEMADEMASICQLGPMFRASEVRVDSG